MNDTGLDNLKNAWKTISESAPEKEYSADELKKIGLNASMSESLEKALEKTDRHRPLLITGSLYLTGHVLQYNETIIT